MKTSGWIRLIGILCIVFGTHGIMNTIIPLVFPEMTGTGNENLPDDSPDLIRWIMNLQYITLLANAIYLMTGIFFLMKKPFSLKLMYIALIFSILVRIVPMLIFNRYNSIPFSYYEINIFSLIGPFIDIVLLIGVYRLAKYYFNPDDSVIKLFGDNIMEILNPRIMKILTFMGIVSLSVSLTILGLWIHAFNIGDNQAERVAVFNNYFPDFLQGRSAVSYLSLAFSALAIVISSICLNSSGKIWKVNMLILVFSCLLLLLNLFQMM